MGVREELLLCTTMRFSNKVHNNNLGLKIYLLFDFIVIILACYFCMHVRIHCYRQVIECLIECFRTEKS